MRCHRRRSRPLRLRPLTRNEGPFFLLTCGVFECQLEELRYVVAFTCELHVRSGVEPLDFACMECFRWNSALTDFDLRTTEPHYKKRLLGGGRFAFLLF